MHDNRELTITGYIRYLTPLDILGDLRRAHAVGGSLSTALGLVGLLPVLDLLEGGVALGATEFRLLGGLLLDVVEAQPDDGALGLGRSRPALLEVGLREPLLVQAAPGLGPDELGGLLALEGEGLGLGGSEEDGLSVAADEELAGPGPDPVFGHCAKFSCVIGVGLDGRRRRKLVR